MTKQPSTESFISQLENAARKDTPKSVPNPVAKHSPKFNKPATHKDKKKASKKGEVKHKKDIFETPAGALALRHRRTAELLLRRQPAGQFALTAILAERLAFPVIPSGDGVYRDNRNIGVSLRADSQRPSLPVDNETKSKRHLKKEDEIERILRVETLFVFLIDAGTALLVQAIESRLLGRRSRAHLPSFPIRNDGLELSRLVDGCVPTLILDEPTQNPPLVLGVADGEIRGSPHHLWIRPQDAGAGRVEGAYPGPIGDPGLDAFAHFPGRLVGEGDGKDAFGGDPLRFHQPGDTPGDGPSFSRSRPCKNEQGPTGMLDGGALGGVEPFEDGEGHGPDHDAVVRPGFHPPVILPPHEFEIRKRPFGARYRPRRCESVQGLP